MQIDPSGCVAYLRSYQSLLARGYDKQAITTPGRGTFEVVKGRVRDCGLLPAGTRNGQAPGAPGNPQSNRSLDDDYLPMPASQPQDNTKWIIGGVIAVAFVLIVLPRLGSS